MKLSVIIPTYNEMSTIEEIINRVQQVDLIHNIEKEIIIIDDASNDGTNEYLHKRKSDPQINIIFHEKNLGKTAGIKTGLNHATGDVLVIQDADLEYHPETYNSLLSAMLESKAGVIYGSRFMGNISDMKWINRISNVFSNVSFNLLFGTRFTDINTCYKLFTKEVIQSIDIFSKRFGFETEITAKLVKKGIKIHEIPIDYVARSKNDGKKINWRCALEMYWGIIKYRF